MNVMDLYVYSILEATYILNEGQHSTVLSKEQVCAFCWFSVIN